MNYFFISIHFLLFIKIYQLIKADNNIEYLSFNTSKTYDLKNDIIIFHIKEEDEKKYNKYLVHIYQKIGDISLYGLKCPRKVNVKSTDCEINIDNLFKHYEEGNLIISERTKKSINLYINLDTLFDGMNDDYYLLFPVICNDYINCTFKIGIYNINKEKDNEAVYNMNRNEEFSIRNIEGYIKYTINEKIKKIKKLIIDITFFYGKKNYFMNKNLEEKEVYHKIQYSMLLKQEKVDLFIDFSPTSVELFYYSIRYYLVDYDNVDKNDNIIYIPNNELYPIIIENDYSNYYLKFETDYNLIDKIFKDSKFFILVYAENCKIQLSPQEQDNNDNNDNIPSEYFKLFEKEYDNNSLDSINFKVKVYSDETNKFFEKCIINTASFKTNTGNNIYLHTFEKFGFKFTKNIQEITFLYITMYNEENLNHLYLEVIVPPFCEVSLSVNIYNERKYLLFSKRIQKSNIFYLSKVSEICEMNEKCLIVSTIKNFTNYSSNKEDEDLTYALEKEESGKSLIYIQYLNNNGPTKYMKINKLTKEFSIELDKDLNGLEYMYQVKPNIKYELKINFERGSKKVEVKLNYKDNIKEIEMDKSGSYYIISDKEEDLIFSITKNYFPSYFTYYLREFNKPLEIIPNERIYGYLSEEEKNILEYVYTFDYNVTSFNVEIFAINTKIKIQDITGDNNNCCNFGEENNIYRSKLLNYYINNMNIKSLINRKILITFFNEGIQTEERFIIFRLLPNYYSDNIIYLTQGEEALCKPNSENKICFFYFKIPEEYFKKEKINIYGHDDNIFSSLLEGYAMKISKNEQLTIEDFHQMMKNKDNNFIDLKEIPIVNYYENKINNYLIGYYKTNGNNIRIVYTITSKNDFIISPGEKKLFLLNQESSGNININIGGIANSNFTGNLFISNADKQFILSIPDEKIEKIINVQGTFMINIQKKIKNNKFIIYSKNNNLPSFYLKYDIKEIENPIYYIEMNRPSLIYLNVVKYPLHFYMQIIEKINNFIINFKITLYNYLTLDDNIRIDNYDLCALLVKKQFLMDKLYLNLEDIQNEKNNENYITNLFKIELLIPQQIYLISFKHPNDISNNLLQKYKYMYFYLKPKIGKNFVENDIKIQIVTIVNDNKLSFPITYTYFYTYIDYPLQTSNIFSLLKDDEDDYFIISISSEEIKYLNISFKNNEGLERKAKETENFGQIIYILEERETDKITINISLTNNYLKKYNNKGLQKIYYSIKYFSNKKSDDSLISMPIPIYTLNQKNKSKETFTIEYDNINEIIKTKWNLILNESDEYSYIDAKYFIRYFNCSDENGELCNNYNLSIFPKKLQENNKLYNYTLTDGLEQKIDEKEFNYTVRLYAYFVDDLGEEIFIAYESKIISHKFGHFYLWIIGIFILFFLFISFAIIILCLKIKEEKKYFEKEDENINLKSFSKGIIKEEEEEKEIKFE